MWNILINCNIQGRRKEGGGGGGVGGQIVYNISYKVLRRDQCKKNLLKK